MTILYLDNQHVDIFCYKTYTKRNCNLECQSNYTYEECKCIPYYLPRTKNVTACGRQDNVCASRAKENMELVTGSGRNCQCLPGCFEISFTESKSFGALSKKLLNFSMNSDDWNVNSSYFVKNAAVVHFFFPTSQFTKQIKAELYGFTEILSNVGGLLGLCMGFSFLSMVEILYFVTLKLFCKWVLKHNNKKKNKKNDTSTVESGYNAPYPFLK